MILINRESLARELLFLQKAFERKNTIPMLATVLCEFKDGALKLTATDLDLRLTSELSADGNESASLCLPGRDLTTIVSMFSSDDVAISPATANGRWEIVSGRSRHVLPSWESKHFPDPVTTSDSTTYLINAQSFRLMLQRTAFAVDTQEGRYNLQGVNLSTKDNRLRAVGTNGAQCAVAELPVDDLGELDFVLPSRSTDSAIDILDAEGDVELRISENIAQIMAGSRTLSSRLIEGKFPKWESFIPSTFPHSAQINPSSLKDAMRRALVTSQEFAFVRKPIKFVISKDEIMIQSREGDKGHSFEPVAISCPTMNGDTTAIGINAQNVLDFLNQAKGRSITMAFGEEGKPVLLTIDEDPNYRFLTVPVTLRNW